MLLLSGRSYVAQKWVVEGHLSRHQGDARSPIEVIDGLQNLPREWGLLEHYLFFAMSFYKYSIIDALFQQSVDKQLLYALQPTYSSTLCFSSKFAICDQRLLIL